MESKLRFTKNTLEKLEILLSESGYEVRYEKGNFQSGACVLESRKLIIVNRFFETEGRIVALIEIMNELPISSESLSSASLLLWKLIREETEKSVAA